MKKLIRFDWAIKNILRRKANFDILEGFLSELLKEQIRIKQILESESNQETAQDKFNRVDLLVENSSREIIIIEVQNESELDYLQRMLYGTSKLVTEHLDLGQPYSAVKKIISVNIVYFDLGQGKDYVYKGTTNFIGLHKQDELALNAKQRKLYTRQAISEIYPEYYVIKVNRFDNVTRDLLDEWIYFLKNDEIKDEFKAQGLKRAKDALDVLKMDEQKRRAYNRYVQDLHYQASMVESTYTIGEMVGYEKGKEQGEKTKAVEIAQKLGDVMDDEAISQMTGLSIGEIRKLLR